jgi:hypothetical protein
MRAALPFSAVLTALAALAIAAARAGDGPATRPKYGPLATPLSRSHDYLREAPAPDFWALMPYYDAQREDSYCSVASLAMVMNAARAGLELGADDPLVTQEGLLERTASDAWRGCVGPGGRGVTLDQLALFALAALRAYGFADGTVEVAHVDDARAAAGAVHRALVENERSSADFIVANFLQGAYTGDAPAGHIAPVAAYDAARRRVLILDPDRRWYEPYWVSEETFVAGMATHDPVSGRARGYLVVKPGKAAPR